MIRGTLFGLILTAIIQGNLWLGLTLYERWEGMNDLIRWQRAVIERCNPPLPSHRRSQ